MRPFILASLILFSVNTAWSQNRIMRFEKEFLQVDSLIKNGSFRITFTLATPHQNFFQRPDIPYGENSIEITPDSAWIVVKDKVAQGKLPYYASGLSFLPGRPQKSILFDNYMIGKSIEVKGKKGKQAINYTFGIIGENNNYKLQLNIQYDGTCNLFVDSNGLPPISYLGTIHPL